MEMTTTPKDKIRGFPEVLSDYLKSSATLLARGVIFVQKPFVGGSAGGAHSALHAS